MAMGFEKRKTKQEPKVDKKNQTNNLMLGIQFHKHRQ